MPAALDDRFYPVLLSRMDEPLEPRELEAYFKHVASLANASIKRGDRYVIIVLNDPMQMSAAGRKKVLEAQARFMTSTQTDVTLASFVCVESAFARGAVTALRWVAPEMIKSLHCVANLEAALNEALAVLEASGFKFRADRKALRRELGLSL